MTKVILNGCSGKMGTVITNISKDFKDIKTNIYLVKNNSVEKVNGGNDVRKQ